MEDSFALPDNLSMSGFLFLWLKGINIISLPSDKPFITDNWGVLLVRDIIVSEELQIQKRCESLILVHAVNDLRNPIPF